MTISTAFKLRDLIGKADKAARVERTAMIQAHQTQEIRRVDREIDLAATAALAVWDTRGAAPGYTDPAIKLWKAIDRATKLNPDRWIPVLSELDQIFRKPRLTANAS
jgi:hypothetical protein